MPKRSPVGSVIVSLLLIAQLSCGGMEQRVPPGSKSVPQFKPGFNLFKAQQDIEIGRQSAQQILRETPMLNDQQILNYVQQLGGKLAAKAPGERFPYQFQVVATREINAFALPGGFLFINAGAIAAARNEGELAGVMAHEIAHVALRHGTNQASKAQLARVGLGILGTIASGGENSNIGRAVSVIGGLGANILFLKFGRGAEMEADLEGARIMAEAGYDPRDMANFFQTLQSKSGQQIPEMLSDHPDPGNRIQYILEAIPSLPVNSKPIHNTPEFSQVKSRLTSNELPMSESSRLRRIGPEDPASQPERARPAKPSGSFKGFRATDASFELQVPSNWEVLSDTESTYIFAPNGAYGKMNDSLVVTHGLFVGTIRIDRSDLRTATESFIQSQIEANADFRIVRAPKRIDFGGREGYVSTVGGPSAINGVQEIDVTYTTILGNGQMFYLTTIVPEDEAQSYEQTFNEILRGLRLAK
ncbi:MAG TPA: M48 family metallopeptidase [Blastocatellia bacterium]|nr:M48 family metallopeptidase [Blastocatellia bacterium]